MVVTIFGATGTVGKQLIVHALAKKYNVRAFGRNVESMIDEDLRNEHLEIIKGYIFDEKQVSDSLQGSDFVLSALGGSFDGTDKARSLGMKNIVRQMEKAGLSRIVALGGLGVLPGENGNYRMEADNYPKEFLPVGLEHKAAYEVLAKSNLNYTFVCSPDIVPADADNRFETAAESPAGAGEINAGNLALFMVQELERNKYVRKRVGIGNLPRL
jgi:uncharacterized protein